MIAPCPGIKRGTDATVPMPPGLVNVKDAPAMSSAPSLFVARFRDELLVLRPKRGEVEFAGVADDGHDREARAVLALAVDGKPEMNARLDPHGRAVFVAPKRIGDELMFARRRNERVRR